MPAETAATRSTNPITQLLTSRPFLFVLRVLLGGLFLYSSLQKVQSPDEFAIAVRAYKMLPVGLTNLFALFVAWTEAVAGIMLIFGVFTRKAAGAIFLLLVMFTIAISATLARGLAIDCGCFSNKGGDQTGYALIVRNLFLIAATLVLMRFDRGAWGLSRVFARQRESH